MSIITDKFDKAGRLVKDSISTIKPDPKKDTQSAYSPTLEEMECRVSILKDFRLGWMNMHLPRPELNDLSLYQRHIVDMLAFNTYQQNDGQPMMEDKLGGWRSKAMRPLQRNKAISIAAHMTARQLVPKIFAYNESDDEQEASAKVMGYLVDWAREQAQYPAQALHRVIMSLYSPISWGYTEYAKVYRTVKNGKDKNGKWQYKQEIDDDASGHKHYSVSTDQVYFSNFYEREVQNQDFIIMRRIISIDRAKEKYPVDEYPNMVHVKGGIVVTMDDANRGYYQVYDPHMRGELCEEVIRWRKSTDSKDIMLNGVLITEAYAENPRQDHQYPFDAFYYLPINERCLVGKSLVFALGPESALLNTQYQMVNDANTLNIFPPIITSGSEKVGIDVMVPGLSLAFAEKDVTINPLRTATDNSIRTAMDVMLNVEKSLSESSQDPIQQGQMQPGTTTAYEISRIEQNAATVLGLTMKFMANSHIIPYGKLLLSDILQYNTIIDAEKITGDKGMLYKTFHVAEPGGTNRKNKISFDGNMPDSMTEKEKMDMSWELLKATGGLKSTTTLYKVNPILFRGYKYVFAIDSDVLNPRSAELTRAFDIETFDKAIQSPVANQEALFKDLLMASNPKTSCDPDKYVMKQEPNTPAEDSQPKGSVAKPNMPIMPAGPSLSIGK